MSNLPLDDRPTQVVSAQDAWDMAEALTEARFATFTDLLRSSGNGLFLLVDPLLGDPLLSEAPDEDMEIAALNALRTQFWDRPTWALSLPKGMTLTSEEAPYIVELKGADDSWLYSTLRWAAQETIRAWLAPPGRPTAHRVGGWLESAKVGAEVARTLTGLINLRTQARTSARYLRLGDRRTLSLTVHVLGETQAAQGLGCMQRWHWLDPQGAWRHLNAAAVPADAHQALEHSHPAPDSPPIATFNASQWAQMSQGENVHRLLSAKIRQRLSRVGAAAVNHWPPLSTDEWTDALKASVL